MIKIKGYVVQIIPPDKLKDYFFSETMIRRISGKYVVVIDKEEYYKKNWFQKIISAYIHNADDDCWNALFDKIDFKEGDLIEVEGDEYYTQALFYIIRLKNTKEVDANVQ